MFEAPDFYGDRFHLVGDAATLSLLARLSARDTFQPEVNFLVGELYRRLVHVVAAHELPKRNVEVPTRMIEHTPLGVWSGEVVDPQTHVAVVALARAGILPSQICFDALNWLIAPPNVRQDHMAIARAADATGRVTGAAISGAKIGGPVAGCTLLIPDPMGATGSTIATTLEHYGSAVQGRPSKIISINLIVTPEFLRRVLTIEPPVTVYALRLDRGLSSPDVLRTIPGERWSDERGLNEHCYIVPGAGGLGEVINNSFV